MSMGVSVALMLLVSPTVGFLLRSSNNYRVLRDGPSWLPASSSSSTSLPLSPHIGALADSDPEVFGLINDEWNRQFSGEF